MNIRLPSILLVILMSCTPDEKRSSPQTSQNHPLTAKYTPVQLTADLSNLSEKQKRIIVKLIEAAKIIDDLFWYEAYGDKEEVLGLATTDELRKLIHINYGPWDRLAGNQPFIDQVNPKPLGANFYPKDLTKEEFEASNLVDKTSMYTFIRRDSTGALISIPYHQMFSKQVQKVALILKECAQITENKAFSHYLTLRADAFLTDEYQPSDFAWMNMKSNRLDVVMGPIENYEDALYNYKAAHEAYVLIKDLDWSARLDKYVSYLPELQKGIPVPEAYKKEQPGSNADLNAYDVVFYAGDCNAGSKTIAINLPNDEEVQLKNGSRRLQLKNAMRAKYEKILLPIAENLIDPDQRSMITFDAFFANTMFHEVAHGLGIKNTLNGSGTVRAALKEHYSALEEGKADVLGLYMITQLHQKGEISDDLNNYYVTFMTSIFRSVRFGASSAHGRANMIRFNFFKERGAFTKNNENGYYKVNFDKMKLAINGLSEKILTLQGNGDYQGVTDWVSEKAHIDADLQLDLDRLTTKGIPVDIVFEQGVAVLGL